MDGELLFSWHSPGPSTVGEAFILETVGSSPTQPLSRSFWQGGEDKEHTGELIFQDRVLWVLSASGNIKWFTLILSSRPFKTHFLNGWKDKVVCTVCPTSTLPSMGEKSKYCSRALGPESSAWKLKLNFPVLIKLNSHWTHSFNSTWETENRAVYGMNVNHGSLLWSQDI